MDVTRMTNKEAKTVLVNLTYFFENEEIREALDVAISALSAETATVTEPSDLISRADAVAYPLGFDHYDKENGSREFICGVESYREYVQHLPSVSAERVGEWIRKEEELNDCDGHRAYYWYECSECEARPPKDQWKNEWHSPYCPNCGARMENKK